MHVFIVGFMAEIVVVCGKKVSMFNVHKYNVHFVLFLSAYIVLVA